MVLAIDRSELSTILYLARLQLRRRYTGSWLGLAWSLLGPFTQIAAFTFAFDVVLRVPMERYVVHMAAGLLPWLFMTTAIQNSASSFLNRRDQVIHGSLPLRVFVIADVLAEFFTLLIVLAIALPAAAFINGAADWVFAVPLALLPCLGFAVAAGLIVARLTVFFRDIPHLLGVAFGVLFWFTPIVYHWSFVPEQIAFVAKYNPLALLVSINQVVWHGQQMPSAPLAASCVAIVVLAAAAEWLSRRLDPRVVYWL